MTLSNLLQLTVNKIPGVLALSAEELANQRDSTDIEEEVQHSGRAALEHRDGGPVREREPTMEEHSAGRTKDNTNTTRRPLVTGGRRQRRTRPPGLLSAERTTETHTSTEEVMEQQRRSPTVRSVLSSTALNNNTTVNGAAGVKKGGRPSRV